MWHTSDSLNRPDPYKVEDIHDGWLHQIKYTFGLVSWSDADSVFEGEA